MAAEKARKTEVAWSSVSFADDTTLSFSIDLNDSVFDTSASFEGHSTSATDGSDLIGITDDSANDGKENADCDTPLTQAYNLGGKRFERVLDAGCIKNDVIKFAPVRYTLCISHSKII